MNSPSLNKKKKYKNVFNKLDEMCSYYPDLSHIAMMASISSAIKSEFPEYSFVGFYLVVEKKDLESVLEIGPYVSNILATPRIAHGKGVCGSTWQSGMTSIVNNVVECNNYIACSSDVKSEIVVPVILEGKIIGVLDIDSTVLDLFDEYDKTQLEALLCKYLNEVMIISK